MGRHVSNVEYDVITVLQNKLEGHDVLNVYMKDCEAEGNQECRQLFEQIQRDDERHSIQLREQLKRLLGVGGAGVQAQTGATGTWTGQSQP